MTCRSFQRGYLSGPFDTRNGPVYVIRYRIQMAGGKWKHRQETLHNIAGKKAARAVLDQRIREASSRPAEAVELSFKDFVSGYYRPYLERKRVKRSTLRGYESLLNRHILPVLGDMRLTEVAPLHVEELVKAKSASGMSPKSMRNLVILLHGIFAQAVDDDLLLRSPVRRKHKPALQRKEKPVWTAAEMKSILRAVPSSFRALLTLFALTGVRLGEALGLQWRHVDLEKAELKIEQALWEGEIVPTKTNNKCSHPMGDVLLGVLADHKQHSAMVQPNDFVFAKPDGSPLNPDVLRKDVLYPALDRLGLPRSKRESGFHRFRHSSGSIINQVTGNLKLAQRFLGHADIATTGNVYVHPSDEAERAAAKALEREVFSELFADVREGPNANNNPAVQ